MTARRERRVVDADVERAACADAARVYRRVTRRELGDASAGVDIVKQLNELAHKLLATGKKDVDAVLAVTERLLLSRAAPEEHADPASTTARAAAADELAWRVLEIEHHTLHGDVAGVRAHAKRALFLEDWLEAQALAATGQGARKNKKKPSPKKAKQKKAKRKKAKRS